MIIVAIDEIDLKQATKILNNLNPTKCIIKIGSVAFNSIGHDLIFFASKKGFDIFLDLKLHDIPNTVQKSIRGLVNLPIKMLTIHISGGKDMMMAAMDAVSQTNVKVFGVTTLTSLSDDDTSEIFQRSTLEQVDKMISLAEFVGIHGVVCSPHELFLLKKRKSLLSITPGIRLENLNDDQKRVMSPKQALELGANYIVIGRPITSSTDIKKSFNQIFKSIQ